MKKIYPKTATLKEKTYLANVHYNIYNKQITKRIIRNLKLEIYTIIFNNGEKHIIKGKKNIINYLEKNKDKDITTIYH